MATDSQALAVLVRTWRERKLLTQEQLAALTGLGVRTIRRLESDDLRRPRSESLRLVADALRLTDTERLQLIASARSNPDTLQPRVPRQLPADIAAFTGRSEHLRQLDRLLTDRSGLSAITGTAGVGKTALAVHWAHRVTSRFPDGQLYANLRGFDPSGRPRPPSAVLCGFLEALEVTPASHPSELDGQVAMYRSLLAERRILVLLDNARDAEQVRPLLPGSASCVALVTSRDRLTGLVATEGAQALQLDPLSDAESRLLLANRLGAHSLPERRETIDQIISRCAGLPLALAVVAARVGEADIGIANLAGQLRDTQPAFDIRGVFSWSYRSLSAGAARLFRLLGLPTAQDISVRAAASLAAASPVQTRAWLSELVRAHLLFEHEPGRFTFHDLLREYAVETAAQTDTPAERRSAIHRLLDHYLHTAHTAAQLMSPALKPILSNAPARGVSPNRLEDVREAIAWMTCERAALTEATAQANAERFDDHTWALAWTLMTYPGDSRSS